MAGCCNTKVQPKDMSSKIVFGHRIVIILQGTASLVSKFLRMELESLKHYQILLSLLGSVPWELFEVFYLSDTKGLSIFKVAFYQKS